MKHCKVEVYLTELKLCEDSNMDNVITRRFSKADTIGRSESLCSNCLFALLVILKRSLKDFKVGSNSVRFHIFITYISSAFHLPLFFFLIELIKISTQLKKMLLYKR